MQAPDILKSAAAIIEQRGSERDQPGGERSMARTVATFNALTGHALTERDGWVFMVALKLARAYASPTGVPDDYKDGAAYIALAGESVAAHEAHFPPGGLRPGPKAKVRRAEYCGQNFDIPDGYRYFAVDAGGGAYAYLRMPKRGEYGWGKNGNPYVFVGTVHTQGNWRNSVVDIDAPDDV